MQLYLTIAAAAVLVAVLPLLHRASKSRAAKSPYGRKALLTANELEFFERLSEALPTYWVFPQVAMGALISVKGLQGAEAFKARSKFAQKIVDYVVCDRNLTVIALIELDDKTHSKTKDAARDALTYSAGYPTLRYSSSAKPYPAQIANDVKRLRK